MGGDYEFFGRAEWRALVEVYGLRFRDQRTMDPALMYEAVTTRAVDVISAFSTDGRIVADDLVLLEDDRHAIPPYDAVLLAGPELRNRHPAVVEALERLEGRIGGEAMRAMNASVDRTGESPRRVARDFLRRQPDVPQ
jgi:osmoprotectant transport system permease protein